MNGPSTEDIAKAFLGRWSRIPGGEGGELYPDQLEFREHGLYSGAKDPGEFTLWDLGTYQVVGPSRVRISTATDKQIDYDFVVAGDQLTFTDAEGVVFAYRRRA
jgi:hypothetical protein